jgi:hypothetical protein
MRDGTELEQGDSMSMGIPTLEYVCTNKDCDYRDIEQFNPQGDGEYLEDLGGHVIHVSSLENKEGEVCCPSCNQPLE